MAIILGTGKDLLLKALQGDLEPRERESGKMLPFREEILLEQRELDYPLRMFRRIWP